MYIVRDRRLVIDHPSQLPAHLAASVGHAMVLHAMHSVVDRLPSRCGTTGSSVAR
ncbi:hypothetical protein [Streptomyces sp. NPDC002082]|uniref:hypothetical protein n=1 Tax=Streptomyces sp. NPDC002082 TaxID=3154772 RepID=UPI00332D086F